MAIEFGATVFFNQPEEFAVVAEVARQFPMIRYVEFRGEHPFLFPGVTPAKNLRYYREILEKAGLKSTLHTTMYDVNLATLNPWLKEANVACYKQYIDAAAFLGAEVMVVHGGSLYPEFIKSALKESFIELAEKHLVESLTELAGYGQSRGVKIALENSPPEGFWEVVYEPENHLKILNQINHPNLGALLDFAHAFLNRLDLIDYLEKIRPYLFEIHAHNNWGAQDDHLGLHHGSIDYLPILSHPAVQGVPFIMEIRSYPEVMETLKWLQDIIGN